MVSSRPEDDGDGAPAAAAEAAFRLSSELEILQAMYPDAASLSYSPHARELRFATETAGGASLVLRLPDLYPVSGGGVPEVLTASSAGHKRDLREQTRAAFRGLGLPAEGGEEVLDALLLAFQEVAEAEEQTATCTTGGNEDGSPGQVDGVGRAPRRQHKTVIIWLQHLLNTNKRKLALHPTLQPQPQPESASSTGAGSSAITGVTKPGYPGVLLYSGHRDPVAAHVAELRSQRWQAFQVRYDSDDVADDDGDSPGSGGMRSDGTGRGGEVDRPVAKTKGRRQQPQDGAVVVPGLWAFEHAPGTIVEVESIALAVKTIKEERHRETFLAAIGVK